ncbi:MAG: hypothetical protein Q9170_003606 [Blastenia crenularia]
MGTKQCNKPNVAYLGPPASYSHQNTISIPRIRSKVGCKSASFSTHPRFDLISLPDAFAAVQSHSSAFAVVPFENSTYGTVVFTLDLLVDRESNYPDVLVCGELYLSVCHCLVGRSFQRRFQQPADERRSDENDRRGTDGGLEQVPSQTNDFRHVSAVYSHPQALGQCEKFLALHLPQAERRDFSSTSKAAERVAEEGPKSRAAAICSGLAAKVNGLEILVEGIQDRDDNSTRFLILKNKDSRQESQDLLSDQSPPVNETEWKTLISFTLPQQPSGTLADVLQTFKDRKLNLTGIHSRPSLEHAWHYVFLIEVQGKREAIGGGSMNDALDELGGKTKGWRWLGSWIDEAKR